MAFATRTLFVFAASLALATGCQQTGDDVATHDSTAAAGDGSATTGATAAVPSEADLRNFMEEVFNKGNVDKADQWVAADFVDHTPGPGQEPGLAGFKKMVTTMRAGMTDMKFSVERVISQGDFSVMHVRQTGTHSMSMMGEKPTGNKIDIAGVDVIRYENGKAKEHWGYYEESKFMQQIGMMPPMPGMPGAPAGGDASPAAPADTAKP